MNDTSRRPAPAEEPNAGYALLDCGGGRRLERVGPYVLDRPAPATERLPTLDLAAWSAVDARFDRGPAGSSAWTGKRVPPSPWTVALDGLVLECRATDTGAIGIYPEHVAAWGWVRRFVAAAGGGAQARARAGARREAHGEGDRVPGSAGEPRVRVLNLFAYTGGLTLAAASAGAAVTHVDAARTAVAWARRNAEVSGLADRPVRWIVDDAEEFVSRELRRGIRYDAIVLDPPSYGHGAGGQAWRLEERLPGLLRSCVAVAGGRPGMILLTSHTPRFDAERLGRDLLEALPPESRRIGTLAAGSLELRAASGAVLPAGAFARWTAGPR